MPYLIRTTVLPDSYSRDPNIGWNAGANSNALLDQNATYQFQTSGNASGIVTGISAPTSNTGFGYTEIEYAFYIANGLYTILESGIQKRSYVAIPPQAVFGISRIGTNVHYYVDSILVFSSSIPTSEPFMVVDASLFSGGDAILNAQILDVEEITANINTSSLLSTTPTITKFISPAIVTGSNFASGMTVGSTEFMGRNIATSSRLNSSLLVISDWTASINTASAVSPGNLSVHRNEGLPTLQPLGTFSADTAHASSTASLQPLGTISDAGFHLPSVSESNASFVGIFGSGSGLTGEIGTGAVTLSPMDAISADHAYSESIVSLQTLEIEAGEYTPFDAIGLVEVPEFLLTAAALSGVLSEFSAELPAITLKAQSGSGAIIALPEVTANISGSVDGVARLSKNIPEVSVNAHIITGGILSADIQWSPNLSLTAYTGGYAKLSIPKFSATSAGNVGDAAVVKIAAPIVTATIQVSPDQYGRAYLEVPVVTSVYGFAELEVPLFSITAHIFQVDATTTSYAMNIATNAVSQYTNYHFDSMFRFNGIYYGISNNTMFSLDGTLDNGSAISSTVELAPTDFGSSALKRMPYTYIGGRADQTISVEPQADEVPVGTYTAVAQDRTGTHTRRVRLPKGAKGRYWGIKISNTNGDALDIDSVEYKVDILSRKI